MSDAIRLNIFSFTGKMRILHLSWIAFFISFLIWFNHAPLLGAIKNSLGMTNQEVNTLLILNVALTIPARIIIGMLVDKFGPRVVYTALLFCASFPCFLFAWAESFEQLAIARFFLGGIGAGFVIGIRMVSEWFPAKQVGVAEGIYGGWGNFGSAAAAMFLPALALLFGGDNGWRYAIGATGLLSLFYAFIYYNTVSDTPKGSTYFKPNKCGALEVTSRGDFFFYLAMKLPMFAALALLAWKLSPAGVALLPAQVVHLLYLCLLVLYGVDCYRSWVVNRVNLAAPVPEIHRYRFKQVAILSIAYFVTFGSELAVVSMLPLFFTNTFALTPVVAGLLAACFPVMNLFARPGGGWLSDRFGRRKTLALMIGGLAMGFFAMGGITSQWPVPVAVLVTVVCSFFVQAGAGAVFAVVPLVKRRITGQVAGMTGAYGNVGALSFLAVLSFVEPQTFFMVIGAVALLSLLVVQFLDEPEGSMAEVLPDGTVHMIEMA
ncbi:MAG: NarK family nitrate/nitrite MFS transporter [Magnetococcus sp. MYC-9]